MSVTSLLAETGTVTRFAGRFFREEFRPRYKVQEFLHQYYVVGYQSLPLAGITGFIMVPALTILSDAIGLFAAFTGVNMQGSTTLALFANHILRRLTYGQVLPAVIKTLFFGFAIGLISC